MDIMDKIYLIMIEYFDGTKDGIVGYCKSKEAAIKWIDDNSPKTGRWIGYQYWYAECDEAS